MKPNLLKNKTRRIRKKLFLGEFSVQGFELDCTVSTVDEAEYDQFVDDVLDALEARGLVCGGGGSVGSFSAFCCSETRYGSPTEGDRQAIDDWLKSHNKVSEYSVGPLVDANYGE